MRWRFFVAVLVGGVAVGCGGDDEEETLPNAAPGSLDAESVDWVVDGMECEGEEVRRMVGTVENDEGLVTQYHRGDGCVEAGDLFWEAAPERPGDSVEIYVDGTDAESFVAERGGEWTIRLVGDDGDLEMRQVYPEVNPQPRPELSNVDLGGQWWMEGYPCLEEVVPQIVDITDPPGSNFHLRKVVGDACIGAGENFADAELSGVSVSGEAHLEEDDEMVGGEEMTVEFTGSLRTDHYMRLDVAGQAVSFRRVMADSK